MTNSIHITLPPALLSNEARHIITTLENAGGKARFVGGCVRDSILKQQPGDIDIATSLRPEKVTQELESRDIKVIPTGLQHGTVTVVINKKTFEVTTLRRDIECFGRHATVEYTDRFEEDAARRDFTINAMYCDLQGNIYDYFGGYDDLHHGIIRFVGKAKDRVEEDFLRILRFFRFFARFGKPPMDIEALAAINQHAPSLKKLSGERIQKEMLGLFSVRYLDNIIETMAESRILPHIALPCEHFTTFNELLMLEEQASSQPNPFQRIAILLRTTDNPLHHAVILAKCWRLSNQDKATLLQLVNVPKNFAKDTPLHEQKKLLRSYGKTLFTDMVFIIWAEFLAKEKNDHQKLTASFSQMLNLAESWNAPIFPVKGADLLAIGFTEGKQLGIALSRAEKWWEENDYRPSSDEILNFIKKSK